MLVQHVTKYTVIQIHFRLLENAAIQVHFNILQNKKSKLTSKCYKIQSSKSLQNVTKYSHLSHFRMLQNTVI